MKWIVLVIWFLGCFAICQLEKYIDFIIFGKEYVEKTHNNGDNSIKVVVIGVFILIVLIAFSK